MADKRALILFLGTFLGLLGGAPTGAGQSVFPVRLDAPEPENPATVVSSGGLAITTGTHYRKTVALTVSGGSTEDILDVTASLDNTSVLMRILAGSGPPDKTSATSTSVKELTSFRIYDSGDMDWPSKLDHDSVTNNSGGAITIAVAEAGATLTATVTTPATHSLLTLTIEVLANKNVTFFEHF